MPVPLSIPHVCNLPCLKGLVVPHACSILCKRCLACFAHQRAIAHIARLLYWSCRHVPQLGGYLFVGHTHYHQRGPYTWGWRYYHMFFLIDQRTLSIRRFSNELCFGMCEGIQFVSSAHIVGDVIHFGIGIDDCTSQMLSMTLRTLNATLVHRLSQGVQAARAPPPPPLPPPPPTTQCRPRCRTACDPLSCGKQCCEWYARMPRKNTAAAGDISR